MMEGIKIARFFDNPLKQTIFYFQFKMQHKATPNR